MKGSFRTIHFLYSNLLFTTEESLNYTEKSNSKTCLNSQTQGSQIFPHIHFGTHLIIRHQSNLKEQKMQSLVQVKDICESYTGVLAK